MVPAHAGDQPDRAAHDQGRAERRLRGVAGIQQLAGDATMLFYMTEEAQEGRDAFKAKRKPDFSRIPARP